MSSPPTTPKTPIWLDVDTGHDDAFALLLAAHHPSVELLGVSTVYGNASLEDTTRNTLSILTALNRASVPVYAGSPRAYCRGPASAPDIHGATGLDGTTGLPAPSFPPRTDVPAITAIHAALAAQPRGKAWLVATGALTNIALLFAVHPALAEHIGGVSIMGGAVGGGFTGAAMGSLSGEGERFGNWTPWAEYNIYVDPESAQAVLEHPALAPRGKIVLVPLDLTHQFLATPDVLSRVLHGPDPGAARRPPSPTRTLFHEILTFFAATYADVFGLTAGPPLHDPLAVAAAFAPGLFSDDNKGEGEGARYAVRVVTDGEHGDSMLIRSGASQCGRTVATVLPRGQQGVRIPKALNIPELWALLEGCLERAEAEADAAAVAAA
jgi:uridine nucleosidase